MRESRGFVHLLNSLNSTWEHHILSHQFKFIGSRVTSSPSEDQEGQDPPFSSSRRAPLLLSRDLPQVPFCINKLEKYLITIQIFCSSSIVIELQA